MNKGRRYTIKMTLSSHTTTTGGPRKVGWGVCHQYHIEGMGRWLVYQKEHKHDMLCSYHLSLPPKCNHIYYRIQSSWTGPTCDRYIPLRRYKLHEIRNNTEYTEYTEYTETYTLIFKFFYFTLKNLQIYPTASSTVQKPHRIYVLMIAGVMLHLVYILYPLYYVPKTLITSGTTIREECTQTSSSIMSCWDSIEGIGRVYIVNSSTKMITMV